MPAIAEHLQGAVQAGMPYDWVAVLLGYQVIFEELLPGRGWEVSPVFDMVDNAFLHPQDQVEVTHLGFLTPAERDLILQEDRLPLHSLLSRESR